MSHRILFAALLAFLPLAPMIAAEAQAQTAEPAEEDGAASAEPAAENADTDADTDKTEAENADTDADTGETEADTGETGTDGAATVSGSTGADAGGTATGADSTGTDAGDPSTPSGAGEEQAQDATEGAREAAEKTSESPGAIGAGIAEGDWERPEQPLSAVIRRVDLAAINEETLVSGWVGRSVHSRDGTKIGSVDEMVLSSPTAIEGYAIAIPDGVLGLGSFDVMVPASHVRPVRTEDGEMVLVLEIGDGELATVLESLEP